MFSTRFRNLDQQSDFWLSSTPVADDSVAHERRIYTPVFVIIRPDEYQRENCPVTFQDG